MSVVSSISVFSNNSSAWGINARLAFAMDNVLAVAVGLCLRFTIDLVTKQNIRLGCSLIGLWEGVVSLHFINKMPYSYDPYIAFSIRLFVDYYLTESINRLVIVIIWSAVGMALADVAPGIWKDTGLHRVWRQIRRDLYVISTKIPRVNVFPRTRTVRFSPSRTPSASEDASSLRSPSVVTPTVTSRQGPPLTRVIPPTPSPAKPPRKRHVPGSFPLSETDSDIGSVLGLRPPESGFGTAYSRYSAMPRRPSDTISELSTPTQQDLDDANISSSPSSSATTIEEEARNAPEIPDEVHVTTETTHVEIVKDENSGNTPRPAHINLPPTPADSSRAFEYEPAPPPTATMPVIPDTFDAPGFSDWENVTKEDAKGADLDAPAPPPKDNEAVDDVRTEVGGQRTPVPSNSMPLSPAPQPVPPPIPRVQRQMTPVDTPRSPFGLPFTPSDPGNFESTLVGEQPSQPPPLNDLLGWGTDRPPSYSEPLAGNGVGGFTFGNRPEKSGPWGSSTIAEEPENTTPVESAPASGNHISHISSEDPLQYVDDTAPPAEQQPPATPSDMSVASEFLASVTDRLRQAVVLRSQMVQMEGIVAALKALKESGSGWTVEKETELSRAEKAYGKMVRKAERRYTDVLETSSLDSPPPELDLTSANAANAASETEEKVEQMLELHLKPTAKSIKFGITIGMGKKGKTQRPIVIQTLESYHLPHTISARSFTVNLPESQYAEWLEKNRRTDIDE